MTGITKDHERGYAEEGYFVLEKVIPEEELALLRAEAEDAVAWQDRMIREGGPVQDITHGGRRYFIPFRSRERASLRTFLFGRLMEELCLATIGDTAYLLCEMFVVKPPSVGLPFGWHQDSGYLSYYGYGRYPPYVTIWCALDDMTEHNGTLYVIPFSEGGSRDVRAHHLEGGTQDKVSDFGPHPGNPVAVPAGSVVVLSSLLPHRSSPNTSPGSRAAYLCQYSPVPVLLDDGSGPILMADPFLHDGRRVG
jgi:ectoine hydroxylase-related dioxygenase (phytanoyl-CoA dioxygenase family)